MSREFDVRPEQPALRHQLIFETYGVLSAGDSFELINHHDPKPLHSQFAGEHAGEFAWQPLQEGPEVWRVQIGRTVS